MLAMTLLAILWNDVHAYLFLQHSKLYKVAETLCWKDSTAKMQLKMPAINNNSIIIES